MYFRVLPVSKVHKVKRVNRVSLVWRVCPGPKVIWENKDRRDPLAPRETEERWECPGSLESTVFPEFRDRLETLVFLV